MNRSESLEEAARRTCDFEETAMAGVEMAKDPEIIAAINQLNKAIKKYNRYFVFVFVTTTFLKAMLQPDALGIIVMVSFGLAFFLGFIMGDD